MVIRYYRKLVECITTMGHSIKEISAIQRERGEISISDNSKCTRTSTGVGGLTSSRGRYGWFLE
jgi:hypothetical protein